MNGPGVSAEWTQGGESEWNSAAASADETRATLYQDFEIPRGGQYALWVRYADWAAKSENFTVTIAQDNAVVFRHEFGAKDVVDPHDEISMYWSWAFAWDSATATLKKGPVRLSIQIEKAAEARRHVDCFLLTNDLAFKPSGRQKPDFAAMRYLRRWSTTRKPFASLLSSESGARVPESWVRPKVAGRDFLMPWNIAKEFWPLLDKPAAERPLYPFNAEPIEEFVAKYKGAREVPLFQSKLVVPVIYINEAPEYLKEGSPFLRYIRETKVAVRDPHKLRRCKVERDRCSGRMATAQWRTERSVSGLDFRRECWLRVGFRARGVEDLAVDVAARVARSAPAVLHERTES